MKIGLLEAGITPDELLPVYGTYSEMFQRLFEQAGFAFTYQVYPVREGIFPLQVDECDGWLITGSRFSVCDQAPWMRTLQAWIRRLDQAKKPLLGICFGHQIIAAALGGKVWRHPQGWGVGVHHYRFDQVPAALVGRDGFSICAMHQDQVATRPESACVVAHSAFCPYAALAYADHILTFQGHPEFTPAFEQALIQLRQGAVIPAEAAQAGLLSLADTGRLDSLAMACWMGDFLQSG